MPKEKLPSIIRDEQRKLFDQKEAKQLAEEIGQQLCIYQYKDTYLGRRLDRIHYEFKGPTEVEALVKTNMRLLLNREWDLPLTDKVEDKITKIEKYIIQNISYIFPKIGIKGLSDDGISDVVLEFVPKTCIVFRNGIFDFNTNQFLEEYERDSSSGLYKINNKYLILWYMNMDFIPDLDLGALSSIYDMKIDDLHEIMSLKNDKVSNLIWNMSHGESEKFDLRIFEMLCDMMGYYLTSQPIQKFGLLAGDGNNGKNTLFEKMIGNNIFPNPSNVNLADMEDSDKDPYLTGRLARASHNLALENKEGTYSNTIFLKDITGGSDLDVNSKYERRFKQPYVGKHIFAVNNMEKVKFRDTSDGFIRRIQLVKLWFHWSSNIHKRGTFRDSTISNSYFAEDDFKLDSMIIFYLAGWSMCKNLNKSEYTFCSNDYEIKEFSVEGVSPSELVNTINKVRLTKLCREDSKNINKYMKIDGFKPHEVRILVSSWLDIPNTLDDDEVFDRFLEQKGLNLETYKHYLDDVFFDNKIWVSIKTTYELLDTDVKNKMSQRKFTSQLKARFIVEYKDDSQSYIRGVIFKDNFIPDTITSSQDKKKIDEKIKKLKGGK